MKFNAGLGINWLFKASLAAICFCWPVMASAIDGPTFKLPAVKPKISSGLTLEVDGRGIDANGYRPIRVTISTLKGKPLTADRQVRVVLGCQGDDFRRITRVSQVIEMPEGSATATATVLVPQGGALRGISIDTFEGGERLDDLSQGTTGWPSNNNWIWNWTEARPALLLIDSNAPSRLEQFDIVQAYQSSATDSNSQKLPDVRQLLNLFPDPNRQPWMRGNTPQQPKPVESSQITDAALLTLLAARSRATMLPPHELPGRWIELSQFDVVVVSLEDLKQMAKGQPKQLAALRDWLSTGPLLIVYGCGKNFGELRALEKLLELPQLETIDKDHPELVGWTIPTSESKKKAAQMPFDENGEVVATNSVDSQTIQRTTQKTGKPVEEKYPPPFAFRPAKLGCLAAIGSNKPFPGSRTEWNWVFEAAGQSHYQWFKRNGFSMQRMNADFWKLLIPGVGRAPVWSYLVLVSLFAVTIGPLNYLLLDRARRLYLLLITVPVGALVVTTSLFAFAMVSDGVRTRVRIRSFADLDQQTGQAAVWSRQSYYAAIAPSQGLHFPEDTTIFPLSYDPGDRSRDRSTLLVWDGEQQLRGSYLTSRTAAQFMICRATTTQAEIKVTEGAAAGTPPKIENRLGSNIKYLLVRDSRGDFFAGAAIRDKTTTELQNVELSTAQKAMLDLSKAVYPELPPGYEIDRNNDSLISMLIPRRSRYTNSDNNADAPETRYGLLESNIRTSLEPVNFPPPLGTYIAIVETSPVVITGIGQVKEEASFHVIRGRY